jgi:hypothetical protein
MQGFDDQNVMEKNTLQLKFFFLQKKDAQATGDSLCIIFSRYFSMYARFLLSFSEPSLEDSPLIADFTCSGSSESISEKLRLRISEKSSIFVTSVASGFTDTGELEAMLWIQIRIQIGSGFNGVLDPEPDPYPDSLDMLDRIPIGSGFIK